MARKSKRQGGTRGSSKHGIGHLVVGVRCPPALLARLDAWRARIPTGLNRASAMRWLVEQQLKAEEGGQ